MPFGGVCPVGGGVAVPRTMARSMVTLGPPQTPESLQLRDETDAVNDPTTPEFVALLLAMVVKLNGVT